MKKQSTQSALIKWKLKFQICFFLFGVFIFNKTLAQQPPPFSCNTTVYLFQGNPTNMFGLDLNTGIAQSLASPLIANPPNQYLNAFGYNRVDNYIWGYRINTNQLIRVASDYSFTTFAIAGLPSNKIFNVADISDAGIMYLYLSNDTTFYRIDLNPIGNPQLILPNLAITPSPVSDWAFSPIDGNIYSIISTLNIYRFDTLGVRTDLGIATGGGIQGANSFGAIFMDSIGNMYAVTNQTGKIFKIAQPNTGNITATFYAQGATSTNNDGAANPIIGSIPLITVSNDSVICKNTSIQLNASASSGNILWQSDPTLSCTTCNNPIASPVNPTTYYLTANDNGCISNKDSVTVSFYNSSMLAVSNNISICEGSSTTLNADPTWQVNWIPTTGLSCDTCNTTVATPTQTTTYIATTDLVSCVISDSVIVTVNPVTTIQLSNDTTICANDTLQLNAITTANSVTWSPQNYLSCYNCFNPVCVPATDITYTVTPQNVQCPSSSIINIVAEAVNLLAGNDTIISNGSSVSLNATGADNYLWNFNSTLSDSIINNPIATPTATTNYIVTGFDANGCKAIDTVKVTVQNVCNFIYVPNAFSPNKDGINEIFKPILNKDLEFIEMEIYNRWGQNIFSTNNLNLGWNGKIKNTDAAIGVYVYLVKYYCNKEEKYVKGNLTVLR